MNIARIVVTGLVAICSACGGGSQPEPAAPAKVTSTAVAEEPEPLTPVSAPQDVFAVIRVGRPARLVDAGMKWSTLPFDWRTLLAKELPGADRVIDFDAPMDLVAMIDPSSGMEPEALFAASIGVASVDAALSFFQERGNVVKRSERLIRIDADVTCIAARALGKAPARLVCGSDEDAIAALLPYMTRGLPTETVGTSDLHAHVLAEPFRRRYGAQATLLKTAGVPFALRRLALDHPRFDGALRELLYGGADELLALLQDLDRIALDLSLSDDQSRLTARTTLALRSAESKTGAILTDLASRAAAPPESFWSLPAGTPMGVYSQSVDRAPLRDAIDDAVALGDGLLDFIGLDERLRKPIADAARGVLLLDRPIAYCHLPAEPEAGKEPDAASKLRREIGHHLAIADGSIQPVADLLAAVGRALGDRGFRKALEEHAELPEGASPTVRERRPRAGRGLPDGAKAFELRLPRKLFEEDAGAPLSVVVLVASGKERSYVGVSTDEAELVRLVTAAHEGKDVLGTREALAPLRKERAVAGGFTTLLAVLTREASLLSALGREAFGSGAKLASRAAVTLPHRGQTPVFFRAVPEARGPRLELSWEIPREAVQDIVALFVAGQSFGP